MSKEDGKKVSELLRKREITPTEKKFIQTSLQHLGEGSGKKAKKPVLTLPKKGKK